MSNRWENIALGEVCEVLDSRRKPITKRDRSAGEYPYYGATGILDYVHDYIFDEKLILIGEDGAKWGSGENTAFIADGKYWVNNHAHVIRPDRKVVLDNWLVYFLNFSDLSKYVTGLTVPKLNQAKMREISLPLPPISEQKEILHVVDKIFEKTSKAKENAEKNLQNARELFESCLQSIFTIPGDDWEEKNLGDVCEYFNGKAHEQCIDDDGEYIVVNSKFIATDGQMFKRTDDALFPLYSGDIAMVLSDVPNGKALAKCYLIEKNDVYTLNQRICAIRSEKFDSKFLYYQLNRNRHFLNFDNGENQTNLRLNQILACPLFLPSMSEQKKIANQLDQFRDETIKLEAIYQQKLADLEELKKSILHKAFNGELVGACS